MAYSIKRHEVDRLLNVLVALGWSLVEERYENRGITLVIHKELSEELLKASGELEKASVPQ
ncbi:MAG: hypothetical protein V2A69_10620 [Pseudomonadota bacterium]